MTVLLDTHVWLWWILGSNQLSAPEGVALDRLASRAALRLAAVSLWAGNHDDLGLTLAIRWVGDRRRERRPDPGGLR